MILDLDALADSIADKVAAKVAAKLREERDDAQDELLPVNRVAEILHIGHAEATRLIDTGALLRAPEIAARRVKRSEVARYATRNGNTQ